MPSKIKEKMEAAIAKQEKLRDGAIKLESTSAGQSKQKKYEGELFNYLNKKFPGMNSAQVMDLSQFGSHIMLTLEASASQSKMNKTQTILSTINPLRPGQAKRNLVQAYIKAIVRNEKAFEEFKQNFDSGKSIEAAAIATHKIETVADKKIRQEARVKFAFTSPVSPQIAVTRYVIKKAGTGSSLIESQLEKLKEKSPTIAKASDKAAKTMRQTDRAIGLGASYLTAGTMTRPTKMRIADEFAESISINPTFKSSIRGDEHRTILSVPENVLNEAEAIRAKLPKSKDKSSQSLSPVVETLGDANRDLVTFHKLGNEISPNGKGYVYVETSTPPEATQSSTMLPPQSHFIMAVPASVYDSIESVGKGKAKIAGEKFIERAPSLKKDHDAHTAKQEMSEKASRTR